MKLKLKTQKQQKLDAELGLIIGEFGRAMWSADKVYISRTNQIVFPHLTINMYHAWIKYVDFCRKVSS